MLHKTMNTWACGLALLLSSTACRGPGTSWLHDGPATRDISEAELQDSATRILGIDAHDNNRIYMKLGGGNIYHPVIGCNGAEQLARIFEFDLPSSLVRVKAETLKAKLKEGRTLSCDPSLAQKMEDAAYDAGRKKWQVPSGVEGVNYLLREEASGCARPKDMLSLFGISSPADADAKSLQGAPTGTQVLTCRTALPELVGRKVGEAASTGVYWVKFGKFYHEAKNCKSPNELTNLLGISMPARLNDISEQILIDRGLIKLKPMSCTGELSDGETSDLHIDDEQGMIYAPIDQAGNFYALDMLQTNCQGQAVDSLLKALGYDISSGTINLIYEKPVIAGKAFRFDCSLINEKSFLLGKRIIRTYPEAYSSGTAVDPRKLKINTYLVFSRMEAGIRHNMVFSAVDGELLSVPLPEAEGDRLAYINSFNECRSEVGAVPNADRLVKYLSSTYLNETFDSLQEIPTLVEGCNDAPGFQLTNGTPLYDVCLGETCLARKPKHSLVRVEKATLFLESFQAAPAEGPLKLEPIVNEIGSFDYRYRAFTPAKDPLGVLKSPIDLEFINCDSDFLGRLGFVQEASSNTKGWLDRWTDFYQLRTTSPATPSQKMGYSCRGLSKNNCIVPVAGSYNVNEFNGILSDSIQACTQKRLEVVFGGPVTIFGMDGLSVPYNPLIEELVFSAANRTSLLFDYRCELGSCEGTNTYTLLPGLLNPKSQSKRRAIELNNLDVKFQNSDNRSIRLTGLNAINNDVRLIDSSIQGLSTMEEGVKLVQGNLFCVGCKISAKSNAISARGATLLITGGKDKDVAKDADRAQIESPNRALLLTEGAQTVLFKSLVTSGQGFSLLSNRIENPKLLIAQSKLVNGNPLSRSMFQVSFFVPANGGSDELGLVDLRQSEIKNLPDIDVDHLLLRQEATSVGKGGSFKSDARTKFFRSVKKTESDFEEKEVPLNKPSLESLIRCEEGNKSMDIRVAIFQLCSSNSP